MSLSLTDLLEYDNIVVQCHDNPDADALASGFALKWYLENNGKKVKFIYGGKFRVSKSNLVLMIQTLGINAEYVAESGKTESEKTEFETPKLLVTVDCQYGESNVTRFEAEKIAVIDHHQVSGKLPEMSEVRSNYGSCSTVLYEMFKAAGVDINENADIATAMYYGLMTDTNGFAEVSHPADKDLRDFAAFNSSEITLFKNSNLSKEELGIAGNALNKTAYNDRFPFAVIEAAPCDPNILGIISDMLLEVDSVKTCLVYSILPFGVKISVRSCIKEVKASELAGFIAAGLGGGGGHLVKAGGFLKKDLIEQAGVTYDEASIRAMLNEKMLNYFEESEVIRAGEYSVDISGMKKYKKKDITVGFVPASKLADPGTAITVRTLEGDVDIKVEEDNYIIIGIEGEVYPCKKAKFERSYIPNDEKYVFPGEYAPAVVNTVTGDRLELLPFARNCRASGGSSIFAMELDHRVKVFTSWDRDKYYLGTKGDFLAARDDDPDDIYIIARKIFFETYAEI